VAIVDTEVSFRATPSELGIDDIQLTPSSLLARNATLNLIAEGWTFLVLVVAMPKLVSLLGDASFGLFSLAWVVIGYLSFLDVGVNRAATKFVSEHLAGRDDISVRQVIRTAIITNLALGLAGGLAVGLASPYLIHSIFKVVPGLENQARLTFYAVALAIPVLLVQGIFRAVLSSFQRFGWINAVNILCTTAQWGAAVVLAWKGHTVGLVVFGAVVARVISTFAYGVLIFRLVPSVHLFQLKKLSGLSALLGFGGWVSVSQLIGPILIYLDRMLIASFVSLGAVTLYTVPYEVTTRLRVIPSSLVNTLYPAFSERGVAENRRKLQHLYEHSVRYVLLFLIPGSLFLLVLGPDLLTLWMGSAFAKQTAIVLQLLALGVLANGISYVPYNLLQALGRPDLTGKFHLLELPGYIVICVLLVSRWGITGSAITSTVRFTFDAGLLFWAAGKYCRCSLQSFCTKSFWRLLMLGSMLGLGLVMIRFGANGVSVRLLFGALALLIYAVGVWILAIESVEKPRINEALRMVLGRSAP